MKVIVLFMKVISHNPKQYKLQCVEMYLQRPVLYNMHYNGLRLFGRLEGLLAWNIPGASVGKGAGEALHWGGDALPHTLHP